MAGSASLWFKGKHFTLKGRAVYVPKAVQVALAPPGASAAARRAAVQAALDAKGSGAPFLNQLPNVPAGAAQGAKPFVQNVINAQNASIDAMLSAPAPPPAPAASAAQVATQAAQAQLKNAQYTAMMQAGAAVDAANAQATDLQRQRDILRYGKSMTHKTAATKGYADRWDELTDAQRAQYDALTAQIADAYQLAKTRRQAYQDARAAYLKGA